MSELLNQFRAKNPQYEGVDDAKLADGIYNKYYAGTMDRADFDLKVGGQQTRPDQPLGTAPQPDLWDAGDQFASGIWQGLGDEIKAGTAAAKEALTGSLSFGDAYDQALPQYQRARERYKKENGADGKFGVPSKATAIDVAGQALPWLVAAPLMPFVGPGASMGQKIVSGAKLGAPIGAASGATNAEGDFVDRLIGAGTGAAVGTVFGAAAPPVIEGAIGLVKLAINQLIFRLPFKQQYMAARKIAEAMFRDGVTPEQAAVKMQEMGSEAALLDLGPNTRALAGAAQQTPGEGKTRITNFLVNRQEGVRDADKVIQGGQFNRVKGQIEELVPETYGGTEAGIAAARKVFGKEYNAARDGGDLVDVAPMLKELDDEISRSKGGIKSSLQKVRDLLVDENGNPEITIETLHQSKIAIDELMSGEARSSMGSVSKGRVKDYINKLLDSIGGSGESGALYTAARTGTRGEWMKQEALESGVNFMRGAEFMDANALQSALAKMSPEELHSFRVGAVQALKASMSNNGKVTTRNDVVKKLMDLPDLEPKIKLAFGDDAMYKKYITGLESEKEMFKGYAMMGGSQTAEREAAKADSVIDPSRFIRGVVKFKSPNPLDWAGGMVDVLGGAKDRLLMPERLSKNLGDALTGRDAAAINRAFKVGEITDKTRMAMLKALTASGAAGGQGTMQNALGVK
jgi:hypothetical protein